MPTFRVDLSKPTNGSAGLTWPDAFNTFASLPAMAGGDVVEIRSGVLAAQYNIGSNGSAGNPIIFRSDPTQPTTQRITLGTQGMNGLVCTSRSNIQFENFEVYGQEAWTAPDTVGLFINGASTNISAFGVIARYARLNLVGGFATSNIVIRGCAAIDCVSDGLRLFSGTGTYVWDGIDITDSDFSRNGRGQASNGAGISIYIQPGHTGTTFSNIRILRNKCDDNYRAGIVLSDEGVTWAALIATGNTTPPVRRFQGLRIEGNRSVRRNGGAGIAVSGAQPSSSNPVLISRNVCEDNGERTTIGNIWTGACLNPIIELNECRRAKSNGTTVGDGQGIFDDQWNDGAVVRWNIIENNIFQAFNPEFTAYGIGIYRCANSRHYGNVVRGCRHGFYIGTVTGATAPVMTGIVVENNTIDATTATAFTVIAATPASAVTIRNNFVRQAAQDIAAQSGTAGSQTFAGNFAVAVTTKYTGNNVGTFAFDHSRPATICTTTGLPTQNSPLLSAGADLGVRRGINGAQSRKFIGAYSAAAMR